MTRINCGIKPQELSNQHLLAEHREIKRIPNCISKGRYNLDGIPDSFTLGKGHVKFFYNKIQYLHDRYLSIYQECKLRGFNVTLFNDAFNDMPIELYNGYKPTKQDRDILISRLKEKDSKFYKNLNQ